jgi:hypothetical protein
MSSGVETRGMGSRDMLTVELVVCLIGHFVLVNKGGVFQPAPRGERGGIEVEDMDPVAVAGAVGCEWGGVVVEVGDLGAGVVAELEAHGGDGGAGLAPELVLERLDGGLRLEALWL